ncbi:rhsC in rhs element domain protein [Escherichia coli]|nr:rhsC in rhs element domain protein [Escherichia coli]STF17232.1 protein rhsA [Escherichia coli]STG11474.1 protein rhsA [Escherichia coli]STM79943.1 protein rhsA [Escherichia coli]
MSGKPAARQGDMTQYGGSIVQGSAGVRIGAPPAWPVRCAPAG